MVVDQKSSSFTVFSIKGKGVTTFKVSGLKAFESLVVIILNTVNANTLLDVVDSFIGQ